MFAAILPIIVAFSTLIGMFIVWLFPKVGRGFLQLLSGRSNPQPPPQQSNWQHQRTEHIEHITIIEPPKKLGTYKPPNKTK